MNIHCFWDNTERLIVKRDTNVIATVVALGTDDPVITMLPQAYELPSLSFTEIEHVMDNWHNMPKPNVEGIVFKAPLPKAGLGMKTPFPK